MDLSTLQCEKASAPIAKTNSVSLNIIFQFSLVFFCKCYVLESLILVSIKGEKASSNKAVLNSEVSILNKLLSVPSPRHNVSAMGQVSYKQRLEDRVCSPFAFCLGILH